MSREIPGTQMGLSRRRGLFAELRAGAYGTSPAIKIMVGYTF